MTAPLFSPADICQVLLDRCAAALDECAAAPITRRHVAAGLIAWDDCCGTLVAAPERIYNTMAFPTEGSDPNRCQTGDLAVDVVVLLVRCVPVIDDRGEAPAAAELDEAYRNLLDDAAVIWNVLAHGELDDAGEWLRANLSQTFVGDQGGCIGAETRISIGVETTAWCPCPPDPDPDPPDPDD